MDKGSVGVEYLLVILIPVFRGVEISLQDLFKPYDLSEFFVIVLGFVLQDMIERCLQAIAARAGQCRGCLPDEKLQTKR